MRPNSTLPGLTVFAAAVGIAIYGTVRHTIWVWKNAIRHSPR